MVHILIDQTDNDPPNLTMDYTHFLLELIITLFGLSILIFVSFNKKSYTLNCHMHTQNFKHILNKLFHMLVALYVSPFWHGIIHSDSCIKCSKSDICNLYVLLITKLKTTCILYASLRDHVTRIIFYMMKCLNTMKFSKNVLKNHKIRSRKIVKHLKACYNVENCKTTQSVSMIMMIYKVCRHVQKVVTNETLKTLTFDQCHPKSAGYIDALGPNVHCYGIPGINIRLIIALILVNSFLETKFQFFKTFHVFVASLSFQIGPIRLLRFQNRNAKLILKQTGQPKTDITKHNRKNGRINTCLFFRPVCKLKIANFEKTRPQRYNLKLVLDTIIIQHHCIRMPESNNNGKIMKKHQILHSPNVPFRRKNHDHTYIENNGNLYVKPCNNHG